MSLLSVLNLTNNALNANSQAISITSNNIANINNPNFARQTVEFSQQTAVTTPQGAIATGITATAITTRNALLDAQVQLQASLTAGVTAQESILQQLQASLGENLSANSNSSGQSSTSSNGLNIAVNQFFNSFQNLATNPTDTGAAQQAVAQAGILSDRFNSVTANLNTVALGVNAQISSNVSQVNQYLTKIASLNTKITSMNGNVAGSAATLVDERQALIEKLAGLMPVTVSGDNQGSLSLTAKANDGAGTPVALVTNGTVNNQISFSSSAANTGVFLAGTTSLGNMQTAAGEPSGSLSGLLLTLSGPLNTLLKNVDAIAQQIVTSVNAAYNPSGAASGNIFAVINPSVISTDYTNVNNPLNTLINTTGHPLLASSSPAFTITVGGNTDPIYITSTSKSLQSVLDSISAATGGAVTGTYNAATDKISLSSASDFTISSDTSNFLAIAKISPATISSGSTTSSGAVGALTSVLNVPGSYANAFKVDPNFIPTNVVAGNTSSYGAGDNSYALNVANVLSQSFSTTAHASDKINGTITQFYAGVVSNLGQALQAASTNAADEKNIQSVITNQRQSVSGVTLDEEMANLLTYQKSFQACSAVMQAIDSLLTNFIARL
ncbi:MAG: flagellar basal body rod C-terminal domain-containing protein [Verrucomicrobiota bacterium]